VTSHEAERDGCCILGLFGSVQLGAAAIDALLASGKARDGIGWLMTDRAAERALGRPEVRDRAGAVATFSGAVQAIAAELRPLTPLATRGAGLLATSPLGSLLVSAGLGSRGGLEEALQELGLAGDSREVGRRINNGAVLISVAPGEREPAVQAFTEQSLLFWRVPVTRAPSRSAVVTEPLAPAPGRDARYRPVIESPDEAMRSSVGASKHGS